MSRKLLVVEDDQDTRDYVARGFAEFGWSVEKIRDGQDALHVLSSSAFDLIVLDRNLPGMDGLTILKTLRARGTQTPVIILSAISHVDERVKGLRAGGDDYLVKPFHFSELMARADTVLARKAPDTAKTILTYADLAMDLRAFKVTRGGNELSLLPREYKLLEYFMRHPDAIVTRAMLLDGVWDYSSTPQDNIVDTHISRLRKKLDQNGLPPLLHTIRGVGYRLAKEA